MNSRPCPHAVAAAHRATAARRAHQLSAVTSAAWALMSLVFTGCGSAERRDVGVPPHGVKPAVSTTSGDTTTKETVVVERSSSHQQADAALAELAPLLASELTGPQWLPLFERAPLFGRDWPTWLSQNDVVRKDPTSGRFTAKLHSSQVELLLTEFDQSELPIGQLRMPAAWYPLLLPALTAERHWSVCQRREQWLSVPCNEPAPLDARLTVSNLVAGLSLEPTFPEGIPTRRDGSLAWPVEVRVIQRSSDQLQPLAGVPVRWAPNVAPVTSAADGTCRLPLTQLTNERVHVAADLLLGPLSGLVEVPDVELRTRPLDLARRAVLVLEDRQPVSASRLDGARLFDRELSAVYGREATTLPQPVAQELQRDAARSPSSPQLSQTTREHVISATRGALDYVVLLTLNSEFASQMGVDRTWYETQAHAHVVEVWSGAVFAQFEEKAMGFGIGDAAAAEAARIAASHQLAARFRGLQVP
jgi:hypothetical protein